MSFLNAVKQVPISCHWNTTIDSQIDRILILHQSLALADLILAESCSPPAVDAV